MLKSRVFCIFAVKKNKSVIIGLCFPKAHREKKKCSYVEPYREVTKMIAVMWPRANKVNRKIKNSKHLKQLKI